MTSASYPRSFRFYSAWCECVFPGDDHRELSFSSFEWIFFPSGARGSFLLHIHCSVPCQELKIDCGPHSKLSCLCSPHPSLSPHCSVSLDSYLSPHSESPLGSACTPFLCCLESICRQFVGEPGLPSSVVSSPRDHPFIALDAQCLQTSVLSFIYFK